MKRASEMHEAMSAPACTSAKASLLTWQGDTCQAKHMFHYHHHYYHYEWPRGESAPIGSGHGCTVCCCSAAMNSPHDFCSHGGPPINCPVNMSAPSSAPATRRQFCKTSSSASPVSTSRLTKHQAQAENYLNFNAPEEAACAAVEASPSTFPHAGPPPLLKHPSNPLPPFPSLLAPPYVLCQHCSRLLLLPHTPAALLSPLPVLESFPYVQLKCGFCLKISKFSTRHLIRASSSSPAEGICSPPVPFQSMPSCITSNGVMQEASKHIHSETEEPINAEFEAALKSNCVNSKGISNGNSEHNSENENLEMRAPLNCLCKHILNHNHINTSEPANGTHDDSTQSKVVVTVAFVNGKRLHTDKSGNESGESLNGTCGNLAQSKHAETGSLLDCESAHTHEIVHERVELNGMCGDLSQSLHVETAALPNGKCGHTEEIGIKTVEDVNGTCGHELQPKHSETGVLVNGNCGQTSKDMHNEAGLNGIGVDTSHQMRVHDNGGVHDDMPAMHNEQEISAYSSVQDWVDSLSVELGYDSDGQFQTPLNCESDFQDKSDKFASGASGRHRLPLHRHLGYSSPSELFETGFSEDEEIKARMETSSTASSSFSSINACQPSGTKSPCIHVHSPSLRSWDINADHDGVIGSNGQDAQTSLTGLLRKSLKVGSLLPASLKTRVVVNGHTLSGTVVKQAEERAGKLRPGYYWYDCKAGFWGVEGGPCLGILPPDIEELNYPMPKQCSNGNTQVYVNGRELHVKDLAVLSRRGLPQKAGRAYLLGFDGVLVDETTGLELKHLGKLAPTVERRGKGFGMFTADALKQSKAPVIHQIKLAN